MPLLILPFDRLGRFRVLGSQTPQKRKRLLRGVPKVGELCRAGLRSEDPTPNPKPI